jgi:hypothetical protein
MISSPNYTENKFLIWVVNISRGEMMGRLVEALIRHDKFFMRKLAED